MGLDLGTTNNTIDLSSIPHCSEFSEYDFVVVPQMTPAKSLTLNNASNPYSTYRSILLNKLATYLKLEGHYNQTTHKYTYVYKATCRFYGQLSTSSTLWSDSEISVIPEVTIDIPCRVYLVLLNRNGHFDDISNLKRATYRSVPRLQAIDYELDLKTFNWEDSDNDSVNVVYPADYRTLTDNNIMFNAWKGLETVYYEYEFGAPELPGKQVTGYIVDRDGHAPAVSDNVKPSKTITVTASTSYTTTSQYNNSTGIYNESMNMYFYREKQSRNCT